jgi:DNA modification methylase
MKSKILVGDTRTRMSEIVDGSIQCVVTSPPYWGLRDYGYDGQIGLEQSPDEYVAEMVGVFKEVWRVLRDDGVLWLNLGDTYSKEKLKNLVGIPWRVAFALQDNGWYLRQDIIWAKPNPMPEAATDRCSKNHEYMFMLTKSPKYYFNNKAIEEPAKTQPGATWAERKAAGATAGNVIVGDGVRNGTQRVVHGKGVTSNLTRQDGMRNKRSVWTITTQPFKGAHFAVMPEALVEPCVLASSQPGDTVFDPFSGSGTVGVVANRHNRNYIGCELNIEYAKMSYERIHAANGLYGEVEIYE